MCRVVSWVVEKDVCYDQCVLLGKCIILCSASFRTTRTNFLFTLGISWLPTFAFQSPIMKIYIFLLLILGYLVGLRKTIQLHLFWHQWLRHRVVLLWCWIIFLGNEWRSFCHLWVFPKALHFGLLLTVRATPFLPRDSCQQ